MNLVKDPIDTTDTTPTEWSSSDESIVTVDENGQIEGIAHGRAVVTAKVGSFKAMIAVIVNAHIESIEIINDAITIPNWSKHQTLDQLEERKEYMRNYMQKYREKQKLLIDGESKVNCKVYSKANVNTLDKDIDKNKNKKKEINKYGEYQNVFFTDEQYEKLKNEFPNDYNSRIEKLDLYIQSTGKKYKDCLATIRNWARNEHKKGNMNNGSNKKFRARRRI